MKRFIALLWALAAIGGCVYAQETRGGIRGLVKDGTGAAVAGAPVRITNLETNAVYRNPTNEAGYYNVEFLQPGKYRIDVSHSGFKTLVRDGIELASRQTITLDLTLELGQIAESVTVTADAPLLESSNATSGQTLESRRLTDLPLFAGNLALAPLMTPGVVNDQTYWQPNPADRNGSYTRVAGTNNSNDFTLDGFSTTIAMNRIAFTPPVYSVSEVRVETNTYDASVGGGQGAFYSAPTKSGTNRFHGTVWETHRQSRWNALGWSQIYNFNQAVLAGTKKREDRWREMGTGRVNDFGFNIGGPVTLPYWNKGPKLLKTKDKLFFFFSGNGRADRSGGGRTYRVPTELERAGNFSEIINAPVAGNATKYQLYDPLSATVDSKGNVSRKPFAGNVIPQNRISPVAQWYTKYYPMPNTRGDPSTFDRNYFNPYVAGGNDYYNYIAKADYRVNDRNNLFVRWFYSPYDDMPTDFTGKAQFAQPGFKRNDGWLFNDVYTMNASTVFTVQTGWSSNKTGNKASPQMDPTVAGMPTYLKEAGGENYHLFAVTGMAMPGFETGPEYYGTYSSYATSGTMNHTRGTHNLKAGYEWRRFRFFDNRPGRPSGGGDFNGRYMTQTPSATNWGSVTGYAQFLLGIPNGGGIANNLPYDYRDYAHTAYFQDDWRVTNRLTVQLGLRYEVGQPIRVAGNRNVQGFDPNARTPISDAVEAAYASAYAKNPSQFDFTPAQFKINGAVTWLGVNGAPKTMYNADKNNFAARTGFAYRLNNRTVLRGGYGRYYENGFGTQSSENFPAYWSQTTPIEVSQDNLTFRQTLADPFPVQANGKRYLDTVGNSLGSAAVLGNSYWYFSPNQKVAPYSDRIHFEIQATPFKDWVASIGWTTSWLSDQGIDRNINELSGKYWIAANGRDESVQKYMDQLLPNPFKGLVGATATGLNTASTIRRNLLLRQFPQFNGSVTERNGVLGSGRYDEVTASVEKRYAQGFTIQVGFTGSKTFSEKLLHPFETTPTRYLNDWAHRIAGSAIWDLPYGTGRKWGAHAWLPLRLIAGGWQFSALYQYQVRGPLSFGKYFFNGDFSKIRLPEGYANWEHMFNTDAGFIKQSVASWQLYVNPEVPDPKLARTQPLNNWDTAMTKQFHFTEQKYFKVKLDMYNAFNHPTFQGPNTSPTSSNFGKVGPPPGTMAMARTLYLSGVLVF